MPEKSLDELVHDLQNALAAASAAAWTLVTRWDRMADEQRLELVEMSARRTSELQTILQPVLAKMQQAATRARR